MNKKLILTLLLLTPLITHSFEQPAAEQAEQHEMDLKELGDATMQRSSSFSDLVAQIEQSRKDRAEKASCMRNAEYDIAMAISKKSENDHAAATAQHKKAKIEFQQAEANTNELYDAMLAKIAQRQATLDRIKRENAQLKAQLHGKPLLKQLELSAKMLENSLQQDPIAKELHTAFSVLYPQEYAKTSSTSSKSVKAEK